MGIKTILAETVIILVIALCIFFGGMFLEHKIKQPKLDAANATITAYKQTIDNKNKLIDQYNDAAIKQLKETEAQKKRALEAEQALEMVEEKSGKELNEYIKKLSNTNDATCPVLKERICPSAMDY